MKREPKLTKSEKEVEEGLISGEYLKLDDHAFNLVAQAIKARKKDTILNIRLNFEDLQKIKEKARKTGVKYQTFISEFLHRLAEA